MFSGCLPGPWPPGPLPTLCGCVSAEHPHRAGPAVRYGSLAISERRGGTQTHTRIHTHAYAHKHTHITTHRGRQYRRSTPQILLCNNRTGGVSPADASSVLTIYRWHSLIFIPFSQSLLSYGIRIPNLYEKAFKLILLLLFCCHYLVITTYYFVITR